MDELTQGPTRSRALLLLGVVFLLGMVSGAALFFLGQRSVGPRRPPRAAHAHPLDRMSHQLGLDADQRRAIETVLDEQKEILDGVLEDSRREIRSVLDPEQQERFDDMRPPRPGAPPPGFPPHRPGAGRPQGPPPPHGPGSPPPPRPPGR